ncbi:MAG: Transcriptional regulator, partial [uncultured Gemmatimonadaceae bacterium]
EGRAGRAPRHALDVSTFVVVYSRRAHARPRHQPRARRGALPRLVRRDAPRHPRDAARRRAVRLRPAGGPRGGAVAAVVPPARAARGRPRHRPQGGTLVVLRRGARGARRGARRGGRAPPRGAARAPG